MTHKHVGIRGWRAHCERLKHDIVGFYLQAGCKNVYIPSLFFLHSLFCCQRYRAKTITVMGVLSMHVHCVQPPHPRQTLRHKTYQSHHHHHHQKNKEFQNTKSYPLSSCTTQPVTGIWNRDRDIQRDVQDWLWWRSKANSSLRKILHAWEFSPHSRCSVIYKLSCWLKVSPVRAGFLHHLLFIHCIIHGCVVLTKTWRACYF